MKRCRKILKDDKRCSHKISTKDPENKYCTFHQKCFKIELEEKQEILKIETKYSDYETFMHSIVTIDLSDVFK